MDNDSDVNLPKATLSKMIRDHLPSQMRISADVVDLIIESCTEFIHLVSAQANEVCSKGEKTTIAPEHVIDALKELDFHHMVAEVTETLEKHRADEGDVKAKRKGSKDNGMTEEEAREAQRAMFAAARARCYSNEGMLSPTGSLPPPTPTGGWGAAGGGGAGGEGAGAGAGAGSGADS